MPFKTWMKNGVLRLLPCSASIVGNPQTGAIHGGAITTLMDTTLNMATLCVLPSSRCRR